MKSSSIVGFNQVTKVSFSPVDIRSMSGCPFGSLCLYCSCCSYRHYRLMMWSAEIKKHLNYRSIFALQISCHMRKMRYQYIFPTELIVKLVKTMVTIHLSQTCKEIGVNKQFWAKGNPLAKFVQDREIHTDRLKFLFRAILPRYDKNI